MAEIDEKHILVGKPMSPFKRFIKKLNIALWVLFFFNMIFLFVVAYHTTDLVDRVQYVNESEPNAKPVERDTFKGGVVPEGYTQWVMYERASKVPNGSLGKGGAWFAVFVNGLLIVLSVRKIQDDSVISGEYADDVVMTWWRNRKLRKLESEDSELVNYDVGPVRFERKEIINGITNTKEWIIAKILYRHNREEVHYMIYRVNAKSGDFSPYESDKPFDGSDICPNCGKFYHEKYITDEQMAMMIGKQRKMIMGDAK